MWCRFLVRGGEEGGGSGKRSRMHRPVWYPRIAAVHADGSRGNPTGQRRCVQDGLDAWQPDPVEFGHVLRVGPAGACAHAHLYFNHSLTRHAPHHECTGADLGVRPTKLLGGVALEDLDGSKGLNLHTPRARRQRRDRQMMRRRRRRWGRPLHTWCAHEPRRIEIVVTRCKTTELRNRRQHLPERDAVCVS